MVFTPIFGALALAIGTIMQKFILRKKKIDIKLYQCSEFLAIVLVMIPVIFFFWKLESSALSTANILIFLAVVVFSIVANLCIYYSMKWEKVSNLEPAKIMEPLFVIVLAIIFSFIFGEELYERNTKVIIPAIIAGAALILSHVKKHHLSFNKYCIAAVIGSFFFALELVISKLILDYYSPITFYFLRALIIFLISLVLFRPNFSKLDKKVKLSVLLMGIVWVVYRVVMYYGYTHQGIIYTTLMFMLGPIFIYAFAWKMLKEKIEWRNVVAAIVIIGCVIYTILA